MKIQVGQDEFDYELKGDEFVDGSYRLIDRDDDLSKEANWHQKGYTISALFDQDTYQGFLTHTTAILKNKIKAGGIDLKTSPIDQYHAQIEAYDQHLAVVNKTKLIAGPELAPYFKKLETLVSKICGIPVQSIKPMNEEQVFHFRIIRPNQSDFNPLHKDAWLDELRDCINVYIPICGSNEKSSLILAESSHLHKEDSFVRTKESANMNGVQFNVPGLISSKQELHFERPNPGPNQLLVFSPYLIHGGSVNLNPDCTRISLEMRFWRKN